MSLLFPAAVVGLLAMKKKEDDASNAIDPTNWRRWDGEFKKYAAMYGVENWQWLKAIALNESTLGTHPSVARGIASPTDIQGSQSYDGKSWGIMQVTLTTARDLDSQATAPKLNDPVYSINLGARYVAKMQKQFVKNQRWLEFVIKSYNQGPGNTIKERDGKIPAGYADEYWARFTRNLERVQARP